MIIEIMEKMKEQTNIKQTTQADNEGRFDAFVSKPFYDDGQIKIYNGNFESVLPQLDEKIDCIITDPPYPDYYVDEFMYYEGILNFLAAYDCRQLVFWSAKEPFPFDYTARHIWDKITGAACQYDFIYERNGGKRQKVYTGHRINSSVSANFAGEYFYKHSSQKPIKVMKELVNDYSKENDLILEPFAGSGTTLLAAKKLGRRAIGIEINERWCEVAAKRLAQTELFR